MAQVICPFCLKTHNFTLSSICPDTMETVPDTFIKDYNTVPPLWLVTVGFSQHGKTTYLAALTLMLENIDAIWPDVYYRALDNYTTEEIRKMRREASEGKLADITAKATPRPLLFNVHNLPEGGSRCLVMYDVAGEIYRNQEEVQDYVAALKQASTTWFLVSLKDLREDPEDKRITELFNAYLSSMEKLRINLEDRNLIVVYTKADVITFPSDIKSYIGSDPFQWLTQKDEDTPDTEQFCLRDYIKEMKSISHKLEVYTRERIRGGGAFVNMVKNNGMNLAFCATSALGQSPDPTTNRLVEDAPRFRVLDPFLWAVTLDEPLPRKSFSLVLDASPRTDSVYSAPLLSEVWNGLSNYGDLTTYHLGQTSPASIPGQAPPNAPPLQSRHRLIGPILEKASPDTCIMAIVTGPILDLEDFHNTLWRDRLLIVSLEKQYHQEWPNTIVFRHNDAPLILVDQLSRL